MSSSTSNKLDFILRLVDRVTQPVGKVKAGFNDLAAQGEKSMKKMGLGMAGMVGAAFALKAAMAPALAQNAALGEVASLGVAAESLELLNRKSLEFSIAYGESATAFVSSAYDIQSAIAGLTGTQLATFTNASNVLAKATKADAATITNYVGTMYGIFQKNADAMGKGAWVEQLTGQTATAVQMFKTTGQGMSNAFTALGATAASAGIQASEQIAILGTLQATMGGGEAGTKYRAFLVAAYGAQKKLGMSFTDSNNRMLPVVDILKKISTKYGELDASETDQITKAFGGAEAMGFLTQLLPKTNELANSIDQLGKVKGLELAEQMANTIADPWERFEQAIMAVRIAFGQKLLPTLNPVMERLAAGGLSVVRWTTLFPNLTRVIGLTALGVLGLTAIVALLTFAFGVWRTAALPVIALWKLLSLVAWKNVGAYLMNILLVALYVVALVSFVAWLGLVKGAMMLWQGVIWMTNAALMANPVTWIVLGIIALVAVIVAAVYFWDEWTSALMNTTAFKWVSEQLAALANWFNSMGGWSGMAKAAWDGIVAIFHNSINTLITMLNKIPGVDIKAQFGELPAGPNLDSLEAAQRAQQTINAAIPSLSPTRASAVPPGGLLTSIQNNSSQNKGTHVEKLEIHTSKPMTTHELEGLMEMAG
ncbi:Prophage PSPPH06, family tail tape measure protein [Pseudomonas syringae pv. tagetis]|uniref:Prophage PSPPH06, family tail tape measure protein n=1 Tax=Pseudomonas syringae pv. tagetis TaxID=129140 RepID=A0A3M3YWS6_9PSED|nr:phage tail tape measure protein [Pseudomonas syringae group genomosp. 7]RMO87020.1 Prophage PSPPH06, family tail tape measure protein [Pseudomonas syringae pv. tagetis]